MSFQRISINEDIQFVKGLLPHHYTVKSNGANTIRCKSNIGIDENDEKAWRHFKIELLKYFQGTFSEINHTVCSNHSDFHIYLKDQFD